MKSPSAGITGRTASAGVLRQGRGSALWVYPTLFLPASTTATPTHYIDQTAPGGGSGSLASPLNAVPSATTATDQVYALKAAQTHPGYLTANHERTRLTRYGTAGEALPRLTALSSVTWAKTATYTSVYDATVSHDAISGTEGAYDALYAVEEDTLAAASQPVSRFRQLTRVASIATCDSTPGSYFVSTISATSSRIYVHGSDSAAPGTRYDIRVTTRYATYGAGTAIEDFYASDVWLDGSIFGYGTLTRGKDAEIRRVLHSFGTIHHSVVHAGVIEDVCYAGKAVRSDAKALAIYIDNAELSRTAQVRRALFDRPGDGFLCHTSGAANSSYQEITVADTVFSGERDSLGQLTNTAFDGNNAEMVRIQNVVVKDYRNIAMGTSAAVIDRAFVWGFHRGLFSPLGAGKEIVLRDCILITAASGYPDAPNQSSYPIRQFSAIGKLRLDHCLIVVMHSLDSIVSKSGSFNCEMSGCVFINGHTTQTIFAAGGVNVQNGAGALGYVADRNTYVALNSGNIWWSVTNPPDAIVNRTFAQWKSASGQDANSTYLSSSSGVSQVFRDYTNGDLRWALSGLGPQVAATGAGPRYLPTRWPNIPTADDAHAALVAGVPIQV